jgi:hypothetical protein
MDSTLSILLTIALHFFLKMQTTYSLNAQWPILMAFVCFVSHRLYRTFDRLRKREDTPLLPLAYDADGGISVTREFCITGMLLTVV